jgi:flagella basal body P-ring formation protein FlgA
MANLTILPKGTRVTMIYKSRNLEIRTIGEALDGGAKGDVIRVRNLTSKSIVSGVVEASDRISVTSPESDSAEAM